VFLTADEVLEWYEKLIRMMKTVEEWGRVQAQWLYLLPIFSSKDIISQMPEEGKQFQVFVFSVSNIVLQSAVFQDVTACSLV
jgi:dynein heavy chain